MVWYGRQHVVVIVPLLFRNTHNQMHAQFDKRHKVSSKSSVNHLIVTLGLPLVSGFIIKVRVWVTVHVSSRKGVKKSLHDLYCQYFLPEAMVKFTRKVMGHSVMFIESDILLIMSISRHCLCTQRIIHGCAQIQNFSLSLQLDILRVSPANK